MSGGRVNVRGIRELRKAFAVASRGKGFDRYLAKAHQRIAQQVVDESRPGIAAQSSGAASAVTAVRSAARAAIAVDRATDPKVGGIIFGATHNMPRRRRTPSGGSTLYRGYNQFRSWHAGPYHIFPEVDRMGEQIAADYLAVVNEFFDDQGVPR